MRHIYPRPFHLQRRRLLPLPQIIWHGKIPDRRHRARIGLGPYQGILAGHYRGPQGLRNLLDSSILPLVLSLATVFGQWYIVPGRPPTTGVPIRQEIAGISHLAEIPGRSDEAAGNCSPPVTNPMNMSCRYRRENHRGMKILQRVSSFRCPEYIRHSSAHSTHPKTPFFFLISSLYLKRFFRIQSAERWILPFFSTS